MNAVLKDVQDLWQNSSCVTVQIPDFSTFASQAPPSDVDFIRDVDPGSTKEFTTQVHHRFLHTNVNAPVTQTLSTEVRLDPPTLSSTPGKSTYEAPNKVGQGNNATFESRSRRGRSVLKGRFYVDEKPPTIGITGMITSTAAAVTLTGQMTMAPIAFADQSIADDGQTTLYSVDAPVSAMITGSMAGAAFPCASYGTEQGTMHLVAHSEPRGDHDRVWVIHPDPALSHFDATTTCLISVGKAFSNGGGISAKFFAALGDFEIPIAPGTTPLDKQRALPFGSDHSQASVTLLPPPP